jgi:sigma-E factor negative regulatory protein RseA
MTPTPQHRELISALADGQLASDDFASALAMCGTDAQALDSWNVYHLVGDILRSPDLTAHAADTAFVARLRARLSQESAFTAGPVVLDARAPAGLPLAGRIGDEAANDASFPWKLVSGFASVAAVAAIAWNAGTGLLSPLVAPQLARTEPSAQQVLVVSGQGTMVRDARMQELLAAHKQFGGASALQVPSGFLRNATFELPQGERR